MEYEIGDEVQVYLPLPDDPDHRYHGKVGEIVDVFEDELSEVTGNPSQSYLYTVDFDDPSLDVTDFRYDDIHPPGQ